jgi:hypothetical protein
VRIKDDDIYGLQVNLAERLSHVEAPGEAGIFLSTSAKTHIDSEHGNQKVPTIPLRTVNLKGFGGAGEGVWLVNTPEIRIARNERIAAKRKEVARKNAKLVAKVPAPPPVNPLLSLRPPPPSIALRPRSNPLESKTLGDALRGLTYRPPDKKD